MIKQHFKLIITVIVLIAGLLCAGLFFSPLGSLFKKAPTKEELLAGIPEIDTSKYNRFVFTLDIDVGNADGDGKEFTDSGALELYGDVSHMYDQDISFAKSGYETEAEGWTDFAAGRQYKNLGFGDGWVTGSIEANEAIDSLENVINNRKNDQILTMTDSACTLSWRFEADLDYLFKKLLSSYTEDLELSGYGRATAVFDPKTYKFQYFTFIISASNSERAGAMLDSVFHWEVKNEGDKKLAIPSDVISEAKANDTGVTIRGGYDSEINPMAEAFMEEYGGKAETVHDESSASMFWTAEKDGISAAVNYMRTDKSKNMYEESYDFLSSLCGDPVNEEDKEAYFYDPESKSVTWIARGSGWYAQIAVSGAGQEELEKSVKIYRSGLDI